MLYSSYWILYVLGELTRQLNIEHSKINFDTIWKYYSVSVKIIKDVWKKEKEESKTSSFAFESFFKKSKPMKYLNQLLERENFEHYLDNENGTGTKKGQGN